MEAPRALFVGRRAGADCRIVRRLDHVDAGALHGLLRRSTGDDARDARAGAGDNRDRGLAG